MSGETHIEMVARELSGSFEDMLERLADEIMAMVPQYGMRSVRGDLEFAAWFERMVQGYEVSPAVIDQLTGQVTKPALTRGGPAWAMLLPFMQGVKGHVDSGMQVLSRYERVRGIGKPGDTLREYQAMQRAASLSGGQPLGMGR